MKNLFVILLFLSAVFCYGQFARISDVSASSYLSDSQGSYLAKNLIDCTWQSWAEGARGNGIGESFSLTLWYYETITGFAIKNGYGNIDLFAKNNRVKAFKIYADGKFIETIVIKDSVSFEQYYFKKPIERVDEIRFEIADVYPGTMYNDTCVAEIALLNERYDDKTFYEEVLSWFGGGGSREGYENYDNHVASVADIKEDKFMLLDYLPFELTGDFKMYKYDEKTDNYIERKNKVARLNRTSSLRLSDNLPRLDGATAMYPLYSSFVRAVYPERHPKPLRADPSERDITDREISISIQNWAYYPNSDLLQMMYNWYTPEEYKSIVQCNTTSKAYERLINGETDIIFCYEPSQAEIRAAAAKGKRFNLTPICKDAFVFIVNAKNAVNNITQSQIKNIYSGRLTNWKTISGVEEPIIAYQRPENSGSQTILQSIMKGDIIMRPILEGEAVRDGMFSMIRIITSTFYNYNCAIGYTFLYYLNQMAGSVGIKALSIDGIAPNKENIQRNRYPFVQTVYAVTTGNESENTKKFIEWILSPQGQELAEKTGYIPVK
jgi:phosphate transport system substrate-binding protein